VPASIRSPWLTLSRVRAGKEYDSSSPLESVTITLTALSVSSTATLPASLAIWASPLGLRASNSSTTRGRPWVMSWPATPPVWKVRMVSWVPGSPIDCAAMIPTASPSSTTKLVAIDRP
jgi:hypothetical protein